MTEDGSIGSGASNTKFRPSASKNWQLTLNNWTEEEFGSLKEEFGRLGDWFVGKEICPTTGTPHLQGCVSFKKKQRPFECIKTTNRIHWEKLKDTFEHHALTYCSKDGDWETNTDLEPVRDPLKGKILYWWQQEISDILKTVPNERTIHWYWEVTGNVGKTTFAKHLCLTNKNIAYVNGKAEDIKYAISEMKRFPKVVIFDFPKSRECSISYDAIESIKNGFYFNGKYESKQILGNCPHVICFANTRPNEMALSKDRWNIKCIGDEGEGELLEDTLQFL